jgi:hypothetical protein
MAVNLQLLLQRGVYLKEDLCFEDKSQIAHEILAYLTDHPDAQDTMDGIIQWWLPEQKIKYEIGKVREIVSELVKKELLLEHKSADSRVHYTINRNRYGEIKALLEKKIFWQGAQR